MIRFTYLKTTFILPFLVAFFYAIAHASFLDPKWRYLVMGTISALAAIAFLARLFWVRLDHALIVSLFIFVFVIFYTYLLNYFLPAQNSYGETKFTYFLFLFTSAWLFFPAILHNEQTILNFAKSLCFFSIIYCSIGILFPSEEIARKSVIELNPSIMSKMNLLAAIYILSMSLVRKLGKIDYLILFISILGALFTGTRGPILSVFLSYLVMAIMINGFGKLYKYISYAIVGILAIIVMLGYVNPDLAERFSFKEISISENSDEGDRIDLYITALNIIKDHPLGIGFGNFSNYHNLVKAPHNLFLEIGTELGIIPAIIFLLFSGITVLYLWLMRSTLSPATIFISMLFLNQQLNSMLGGELTLQTFLLYLCFPLIWRNSHLHQGLSR